MKEEYYYRIYGLQLISEFRIDAFQEVDSVVQKKDLFSVEKSTVNFKGYEFKDDFVIREHTGEGFLYVIKNVVAFLIKDNRMLIDPLVSNDTEWQSFLVGGAMSVVLNQKGHFLLHGSAVQKDGYAYLFLGVSGAGKSSLAMGLGQKGYQVITDDVCSITIEKGEAFISPGTSQIRLLEDTIEKLSVANYIALKHPVKRPKYGYSVNQNSLSQKIKIKQIAELVVSDSMVNKVEVKEIASFEKFELLKNNIYKAELSDAVGASLSHFESITLLSEQVKFIRVSRKSNLKSLKNFIEFIESRVM